MPNGKGKERSNGHAVQIQGSIQLKGWNRHMSQYRSNVNVTDRSPYFIRPYYVKEENKTLIDKEMKCLCYPGILKEGFLAYSSQAMLISRKLSQDKRVVTDFRHLNVRIGKNNLAYPLLKDIFQY